MFTIPADRLFMMPVEIICTIYRDPPKLLLSKGNLWITWLVTNIVNNNLYISAYKLHSFFELLVVIVNFVGIFDQVTFNCALKVYKFLASTNFACNVFHVVATRKRMNYSWFYLHQISRSDTPWYVSRGTMCWSMFQYLLFHRSITYSTLQKQTNFPLITAGEVITIQDQTF